ncbi:MAG: DUF5666 domain-containing protein [Candidatus Promineifilaceae bacterium]|nr:DUF5666 domain-containing protein [Candidatus Promineifilaceae bacterium]
MNRSYTKWLIVALTLLTVVVVGCSPGETAEPGAAAVLDESGSSEDVAAASATDDSFELEGTVEAIGDNEWTVDGQTVQLADGAEIEAGIEVGDMVKVEGSLADDGSLLAREIEALHGDDMDDDDDDDMDDDEHVAGTKFELSGMLSDISGDSYTIAGQLVVAGAGTEIGPGVEAGVMVKAEGAISEDGTLLAREIERVDEEDLDDSNEFEIVGELQDIGASSWTVGGQVILIDGSTELDSGVELGDIVKAQGSITEDGSLLAREIEAFNDDDMDDDDDEDMDDDHDDDEDMDNDHDDDMDDDEHVAGTKFELSGMLSDINGDSYTIAGQLVVAGAGTEIGPGVEAGVMVEAEGTISEDGTLLAREIERVDEEDLDESNEFEIVGELQDMGASSWTVGGQVILIDGSTELDSGVELGDIVKAEGSVTEDGSLLAHEIEAFNGDNMDDDDEDMDDDHDDDEDMDNDHDDDMDDDHDDMSDDHDDDDDRSDSNSGSDDDDDDDDSDSESDDDSDDDDDDHEEDDDDDDDDYDSDD